MRRCPACNLPTLPSNIGASFACSSNDRTRHGVIGICHRCAIDGERLPRAIRFKTINRAGDRALDDPGKYLCATFPTIDAARLAAAMTRHRQHGPEALRAIGWGDGIGPRS